MVYMLFVVCIEYVCGFCYFFCFKQKTAYEMRISDWSSDVCSSDLLTLADRARLPVNGAAMSILGKIFTWWDGATVGTLLNSWSTGEKVGEDGLGNRYLDRKSVV